MGIRWENTALGTEFVRYFCAGIGGLCNNGVLPIILVCLSNKSLWPICEKIRGHFQFSVKFYDTLVTIDLPIMTYRFNIYFFPTKMLDTITKGTNKVSFNY